VQTILIRPNANNQYKTVQELRAFEPPLWLALFANYWEDPYIIDLEVDNLSDKELIEVVNKLSPNDIVILATGTHPSAHIQQKDEMYRLKTLLTEVVSPLTTISTYERLSFHPITANKPRWDLLDMSKYRCHNWHSWGRKDKSYGVIFSSISCPFDCEFCCIKDFYMRNYQIRKSQEVVDDIYYLYDTYGITNFKMIDELFVTKSNRVLEICEKLFPIGDKINIWAYARLDTIDARTLEYLRKAGFRWLAYGIESGNDNIRKSNKLSNLVKTKIKDLLDLNKSMGIYVLANYIFGFWEDNLDTMQETLDFAKELNTEYANFYCMVAYPGSQLYKEMQKRNAKLPINTKEYAQMSYDFVSLPTQYLSAKEVLQFRDNAFIEYFTRPEYLSMIETTFNSQVIDEIKNMTSIKINRKLFNE
jgi:radical SAM superfamily enzyme YgiQ (UPF0313 family)